MGNHYDPNEGVACAHTDRGNRAKEKMAAAPAFEIGWQLQTIERDLRCVEKSVIGGDAVDRLRDAITKLRAIT